jgi:LEA14-like dessication related protein
MVAAVCVGCPEAQDLVKQVFTPPSVSVRQVHFSGVSSKALDLNLGMEIDNPNPIGVSLSAIDYDFALAGRPLASGSSGSGLQIAASGKSRAEFPISVAYNEILPVYESMRGQDEVPYAVAGKLTLDTPIGALPIPFKSEGKLPILRVPKIAGVNVRVKSLSFTGADLKINIQLENPNTFPLAVQGVDYNMVLDGKPFAAGAIGAKNIASKSTGTLEVPLQLDFMSLGGWAYSLLSKKSAGYALDYDATYLIQDHPVSQKESKEGQVKIKR